MNDSQRELSRLFKAARLVKSVQGSEQLPPHLATRLLAAWRSVGHSDNWPILATIFRRALYGAAAIMLLCLLWSYSDNGTPDSDVALANYEVQNEVQNELLQ